ncbi:hypothetical protein J7T55_005024 [Diaporthe amygdali]|uniref:uncharacterized protein n=1 Tax=Phomopsis amygdali TaxID=1214568 RepID=UPI0022FF203B|nr:uncharacterized protein J7T55_005024 [Diaporthe amygdali]KAJ0116078.1 hypothetical protein J7T55_005024 [Diaporthe amygdali]
MKSSSAKHTILVSTLALSACFLPTSDLIPRSTDQQRLCQSITSATIAYDYDRHFSNGKLPEEAKLLHVGLWSKLFRIFGRDHGHAAYHTMRSGTMRRERLQKVDGIDPATLIIELRRMLESDDTQVMHVNADVHRAVADLALWAELLVQCRAYAPTIFFHRVPETSRIEEADTVNVLFDLWASKELAHLTNPAQDEKFVRLGHTAHHSLDNLESPIDKPRNKARNATMQASEANLDKFWDVALAVKGESARTQNWTETAPSTAMAPINTRSCEVNLNFGEERETPTQNMAQRSKQKSRSRKESEDETISSENKPNVSDKKQVEVDAAQQNKPVFHIDSRAWRIFDSAMFSAGKGRDPPSTIRWPDFLHEMT